MTVQVIINEVGVTDIIRTFDYCNADDVLYCAKCFGDELLWDTEFGKPNGEAYWVGEQLFYEGLELEWQEVEI